MLIRVRFKDGRIDLVPSQKLDELIVMSEIEQFERSAGWVTVGKDPIRSTLRGHYSGIERRRQK
jgi:putative N-acetylmannosamine-6-phosphate epimerase